MIQGLASILALVIVVAPTAGAQGPTVPVVRLGILANLPPPPAAVSVGFLDALRAGLKEAGLVEGTNLTMHSRWEPDVSRLPQQAAVLVDLGVNAIVTFTTPATRAALDASSSMPIVFTMVSDPVGSGFVASLARPGGRVTGVTNIFPDLSGKLLELLREIVPGLGRAAVLFNPDNPGKRLDLEQLTQAARQTRVSLQPIEVKTAADFGPAFGAIRRARPDVVETVTWIQRQEIADFALKNRLPTTFNLDGHVEAGGLMSYAPRVSLIHHRAGVYPGDGRPKAVAFPDPAAASVERGAYRVISLEKLIELKLASGLSAPHRQLIDLADVQRLVEVLGLPRDLGDRLDPSVADEYRRLWALAQHAREGPQERA